MILLQSQQVLPGHPQQQAVPRLETAIGQGWQQALPPALDLKHVDIEAPLQAAVQQRAAHQFRVIGDGDFGAVAAAFRVEAGFPGFVAPIRQQRPGGKDQIEGSGEPDRDADQGEAEQLKRRVVELLADVTHQQIDAAPQQGESAAENRGKRQWQQNPGGGNAASMAPGLDNRKQGCHDGRVGDNARDRGNHKGHQGDQPPGRADPFRGDQAAQPVEGSAFEQGCRHREQS